MKTSRLLGSLIFLAFAAAAHGQQLNAHDVPPTPTGYPIYTAAPAGGSWNAGATWVEAAVPGPNSVVIIPANVTVTIDHIQNDPANSPKWVRVDGRLSVSTAVSTRFYVETLYITETGTFTIGGEASPLPLGRTAEIIFTTTGPIDTTWDVEQMSRGLIAEGTVRIFGVQRTHAVAVTSDVLEGAQAMTLETVPLNWQPDDEIVLAGTYFRRAHEFQDELRHIGSLSGTSLTADAAYQYNHLHVTSGAMRPNFHVANLTRNVIFRSQSTEHWYDRGHIILMNRDSQFYRAALIDLGRTDKRMPLNDFYVDATGTHKQTNLSLVDNHRGRYALHVHKAGWTTPSQLPIRVDGCVVKRTFGWAFVNHGSNVDIRRNVAYDFTGAGFVAEDGNEIGNFINNIAIRGHGDGEYLKFRINFGHPTRKQPLADFGFTGDGFWFNGPALTVNGAIANSCNGRGMVWHTTGAVDPKTADATYPYGRYTSFPKDQIVNVYGSTAATLQPRVWNGHPNEANISDLPILLSTNIQSYANFVGFHIRFNNHDNVAWYTENPFNYDEQITPAPGQGNNNASVPTRLTESISNLSLWNDEEAIAIRYGANATWNGVTAINQLDYDETQAVNPSIHPIFGTEEMFQLANMTFNGLTIDGWDIANLLEQLSTNPANGNTVSDKGTNIVVNSPVYKNFAITGTWDKTTGATPCPLPTLNAISPPGGATSVVLSWQIHPSLVIDKFLIRYRVVDSTEGQLWTYRESTQNSITVPTLPGTSYTWQVMTGCTKTLSNWAAPEPFGT